LRYTRGLVSFSLLLMAGHPLAAEEISLKDGTKIVGRMTGVTADTVEVETSYGKVQLKRSDVVTINFPDHGTANARPSDPAAASGEAAKIDEALDGAQYVNRTGQFALTLPPDWMMATDLRRAPETLAALTSRDKLRYLVVMREEYPGSLESYKELTLINAQKGLGNFEELAQSSVTIDGKSALLVYYRGTLPTSSHLPVEFVSAIIVSGKTFTRVSAWCVEPLFHDMQPAFERIMSSYHSTTVQATASAAKR